MKTEGFNEIFSKRLRYYMGEYDMTQVELSRRLNVSATAVYNWCNGIKTPRMKYVDEMCNIFHCERSDLTDKPNISKKKGVKINVLGRVAAGIPIEAIEDIADTEEIPEEMAKTGEFFGLKIKGDSMSPRICDGDTVIVRRQSDAESDEIVIALINGDDATCKKLLKYNGGISLISINPAYPIMHYTNKEIKELPVEIIGKMIQLRANF